MTCPRTEALSTLCDGALGERERTELLQHLPTCPVCSAQLDAFRSLAQDLRAMTSPPLGFDLAAQLQDRLPRRRARPRGAGWLLPGWMPAGLAAGAALASGLWLGGLLAGAGATAAGPSPAMAGVFDPVPPGSLCAAAEICRPQKVSP